MKQRHTYSLHLVFLPRRHPNQVTDGQGLSDNTTLVVTVTDVNQPPACPARSPIDLDLLTSAQSLVYTVSCSDADYNDTFRTLSYFSYPTADHGQLRFVVAVGLGIQTDSMGRGSNPVRSTRKLICERFFSESKCCAESLSVCPTPRVYTRA